MDQLDLAIQATAVNAPNGGMKGLAASMGMNYQTLINKCNPNNETHKLTLREALAMMLLTRDVQILEVMADEVGCRAEKKSCKGDRDLMSVILMADAEHGDVGRAIKEALADGKITPRELKHIRDQVSEAKDALDLVLATVTDLHRGQA